jgi:1,4-dihydroxy-2-naphthoate octaprenyltransferase
MATLSQWIAGARPRTLPAAVAPVVIGTAAALPLEKANLGLALLALLVSVGLQVGVNYANDYSDGIRGTDTARVGPVRLVGQHLANPDNVKLMAFSFFGFAALVGLALVALSQAWIMVPLGALAVVAAWRYTGGDNPYGYRGLGELYVFVFFGLMATLGTLYTQAHTLTGAGLAGAVGVGAIASAILVANNLRDIPTDRESGKRTLAVRLGDGRTRALYAALVLVALVMTVVVAIALQAPWPLLALLALGLLWKPLQALRSGATGRDLVAVLAATGAFEIAYAVLLAVGFALSDGRH